MWSVRQIVPARGRFTAGQESDTWGVGPARVFRRDGGGGNAARTRSARKDGRVLAPRVGSEPRRARTMGASSPLSAQIFLTSTSTFSRFAGSFTNASPWATRSLHDVHTTAAGPGTASASRSARACAPLAKRATHAARKRARVWARMVRRAAARAGGCARRGRPAPIWRGRSRRRAGADWMVHAEISHLARSQCASSGARVRARRSSRSTVHRSPSHTLPRASPHERLVVFRR